MDTTEGQATPPLPAPDGMTVGEFLANRGACDADRTIGEYAEAFEMPEAELRKRIAGKVVMDLGSGLGRFAASLALDAIRHPNAPMPQRLDSVSILYGATDYVMHAEEEKPEPLGLETGRVASTEEAEKAWAAARETFRAWDWNDLSHVPDEEYGVILSSYAFPYYSDFNPIPMDSDSEYRAAVARRSLIEFGPQSQQVFREIARILKPGGTMLAVAGFSYETWQQSPKAQEEVALFFAQIGCAVSVRPPLEQLEVPTSACLEIRKAGGHSSIMQKLLGFRILGRRPGLRQ